jgi:hypothetical protein
MSKKELPQFLAGKVIDVEQKYLKLDPFKNKIKMKKRTVQQFY